MAVGRRGGEGHAACRTFGWVGHHDQGLEEVRPGECAQPGGDGTKVMADDGGDGVVAQGVDEGDGVLDEVQGPEGSGFQRSAREGSAIASLVKGHGMVALRRQQGRIFLQE